MLAVGTHPGDTSKTTPSVAERSGIGAPNGLSGFRSRGDTYRVPTVVQTRRPPFAR